MWNTLGRPSGIKGLTGGNTGTGKIEWYDGSSWYYVGSDVDYVNVTGDKIGSVSNYVEIDGEGELTLNGTATVYNDANVGGMALRAGVTTPPITQWVDNVGANTGIYGLGFAALDEANGAIEIPHDYKEGTNIVFHIHWGANAAPSDTDYVKWQLTYSMDAENTEATTPPATVIVIETDHDTQYEHKKSDFPAIVGTTFKIGDQINFNLKRIAAEGAAYAGVAIVETIGFHYECDTMGSKTIITK